LARGFKVIRNGVAPRLTVCLPELAAAEPVTALIVSPGVGRAETVQPHPME
jgi:hypothetical protein